MFLVLRFAEKKSSPFNLTFMNEILALSKQEKRILTALSSGSLYKEIASDYNISINTVKKHLKNIYRKLHVNKRTKAIEKFLESSSTEVRAPQEYANATIPSSNASVALAG